VQSAPVKITPGEERVQITIHPKCSQCSPGVQARGGLAHAWPGIADRSFGSWISCVRFGGEARCHFPFRKRFILATGAYINMMPAANEGSAV